MPSAGATAAARVLEVSGQGEELLFMLFPHLRGLRVEQVEDTGEAVVIRACCQAAQARCPSCGSVSSRVHGGYARVVADGAASGRPVLVVLSVRRFRCLDPSCAKVTFAGQAGGLTARYRRRSVPLLGMLADFGLELAGRAAARLAGALGVPVHSSTVLRLVMALPDPPVTAAPAVTGVDDFALRKGRVYGTVVADAESGDVIDLLPDREAGTLEEWLKAHPGTEVICRDRAGAYAEGARSGAPAAIQVADRWHLWHNLAEHAEKTVAAHHRCVRDHYAGLEQAAAQQAPDPGQLAGRATTAHAENRARVMRARERYELVQALKAEGRNVAAVIKELRLAPGTVRRYYRAASVDEVVAGTLTGWPSKLDDYKPFLHQRWNSGCTNIGQLHREVTALGYCGSYGTVYAYLRPFKGQPAPPAVPAPPKVRQITRWLMSRPSSLDADDQAQLAAVKASCPHLDVLAGHIRTFAEMMTRRQGLLALEDWLTRVEAHDQPQLHSFANGIRRDQQAVTAGLALPYSSAAMEGNVNKIKMIKRQMYGRAGFALLRKRVLLHPG
jgi:transposase